MYKIYRYILAFLICIMNYTKAMEVSSPPINSVLWSPDGKYIASGSSDNTIKYGILVLVPVYILILIMPIKLNYGAIKNAI